MNKIFTTLLALSTSVSIAQVTIPNGDFENWEEGVSTLPQPKDWTSLNDAMFYFGGIPQVSKSTSAFSGSTALNLRNVKVVAYDTTFGGLLTVDVDITGKDLPAYLKGYIKHSLAFGEKALISFGYKTVDDDGITTVYALGFKTFEGTNSSYIPFKINTNASFYPNRISNTLEVIVSSYNYFAKNATAVSENSNLTLDSLGFYGKVQQPVITAGNTISNGDFSSWYDVENIKAPSNWYVTGLLQDITTAQVSQSSDAQNGAAALQLGIDPSGLPVGVYTYFKPTSGSKYVNGFAKFDLSKGDTVIAYITKYTKSIGLDGPILDSVIFTGGQASYTSFSLKFDGKISAGDTIALQIFAYNSAQFSNLRLEAGSKFLVDNVSLGATPLAFETDESISTRVLVSPNPSSSGVFNIQSDQVIGNLKVYNSSGQEIQSNTNNSGKDAVLDLSTSPRGIYFVVQEGKNKRIKLIY